MKRLPHGNHQGPLAHEALAVPGETVRVPTVSGEGPIIIKAVFGGRTRKNGYE